MLALLIGALAVPALGAGALTPAAQGATDVTLLARMAYSEARSDGLLGMTAVSHVALNRLRQPARFGRTLAEVLRTPHQFVVGPVRRQSDPIWQQALWVAAGAIDGTLPDVTRGSTYFYVCDMRRPPTWAQRFQFRVKIGEHCFLE